MSRARSVSFVAPPPPASASSGAALAAGAGTSLDATAVLTELAGLFLPRHEPLSGRSHAHGTATRAPSAALDVDARYRALVEQIPAVVFMAYLDEGIGEAYVSPQIEAALASRNRSGWRIPSAGTSASIPTTRNDGASKPRPCSCLVARCDPPIA